MRKSLARRIRHFARDESAFISVEAILVMPLLIWVFMAMFVYWDAFRAQNTSVKASYVLADMISRESQPVNTAFINGMHQVFRYMVNTREQTWIRVTSVQYRQSDDRYLVLWSRTTNSTRAPQHTVTTMAQNRHRLPVLANSDTMIVVETWRNFTPPFQVGLSPRTFDEFSVMRPRFLSPLPIS